MHILTSDDVKPGIDLIGDTHGYYDEFTHLLKELGYRKNKGAYEHRTGMRTVQLLGDKLDRGNKIVELVTEQRKMIERGSAKDLMGNHEYNLRCMYIQHPEKAGSLRPRNASNLHETKQTRGQYRKLKDRGGSLYDMLGKVYQTPIYVANEEFRIVHACWDPKNIAVLDKHLKNGCLTPDQIIHAETHYRKTDLSTAIVETLKGKEIKTEALLSYGFTEDELKNEKSTKRVAWWYDQNRGDIDVPVGDVVLDMPKQMRDRKIPLRAVADYLIDDPDPRPVFFGHYCLRQPPVQTSGKYQCLDFGVIKTKGCLTAYRWNLGDKGLDANRLVSVCRTTPKIT